MTYLLAAQLGFIILTIICLVLIFVGLKKSLHSLDQVTQNNILKKYLGGLVVWIITLSILSLTGFFQDFSGMPPRMVLVMIIPAISLVLIFRSPNLDNILQNIPSSWLLNIQAFRIIVEIFLWMLFLAAVLPERLTFEGTNFDILAGILGPIFAWICFAHGKNNKKLAILYNIIGLLLLLNIVTTALLTFPTQFQVFVNEDNTIIPQFPIVFLPGILVPIAYYMHFLSLRQLLKK